MWREAKYSFSGYLGKKLSELVYHCIINYHKFKQFKTTLTY